jgi:hypothetical protein
MSVKVNLSFDNPTFTEFYKRLPGLKNQAQQGALEGVDAVMDIVNSRAFASCHSVTALPLKSAVSYHPLKS